MLHARFLLTLFSILFSSIALFSNEPGSPESCSLPAPGWLNATEITANTIKIEWAAVSGAAAYRVERYDVTHSVQLPDVDVVGEEKYTSGPHDPGTTIRFTVYPKCQNGELGSGISGDYTTIIITVDDIASFTIPNPATGDANIYPAEEVPLEVTDASRTAPNVSVTRLKLSTSITNGTFAEVLVWSHCSTVISGAAHVMYWQKINWTPGIKCIEHHVNENPALPINSIEFKIGTHPFFTLYNPSFTSGASGSPNLVGLKLRNDRSESIYLSRSSNTEHNPCFVQSKAAGGNDHPAEYTPDSQSPESNDRTDSEVQTPEGQLFVHPNPFSGSIQLDFHLENAGDARVSLSDCSGQMLKQISLPVMEAGNHTSFIQASDLPAGMYALRLQTAEKSWTQMLVKAF